MKRRSFLIVLTAISASLATPGVSYGAGKTAGLPCSNAPNTLQFGIGSDAMDDVLACVSGVWHSMIYPPSGTIVPFNLISCPNGWVTVPALAGRAIIGAGSGMGLSPRAPGDSGGEEMHTMTLAELVPHNITFTFGASDKGGKGNGYAYSDNAGGSTVRAVYNKTSNTIGGGNPFNVMMPYYALLYCMKP